MKVREEKERVTVEINGDHTSTERLKRDLWSEERRDGRVDMSPVGRERFC